MDEVCEHAEGGDLRVWGLVDCVDAVRTECRWAYQCDDLHEAPEGEEHSEEHLDEADAGARRCFGGCDEAG
jgi:hypothetical protein